MVEFAELTTSLVVARKRASRTSWGDAAGWSWRYRAATPAVAGAAIDVPLLTAVAVGLVIPSEVMLSPGANQSMHDP